MDRERTMPPTDRIRFGRLLQQYSNSPYAMQRKLLIIVEFFLLLCGIGIFFLIADSLSPRLMLLNIIGDTIAILISIIALLGVKIRRLDLVNNSQYFIYTILIFAQILPEAFSNVSRPIESLFITVGYLGLVQILFHLIQIKPIKYILQGCLSNSILLAHYGVIMYANRVPWGTDLFQVLMAFIFLNVGIFLAHHVSILNQQLIQRLHEEEEQKLAALTKVVEGFVPICANCKAIRTETPTKPDVWLSIEQFISEKSKNVQFTHGLCPRCIHKLYPELSDI